MRAFLRTHALGGGYARIKVPFAPARVAAAVARAVGDGCRYGAGFDAAWFDAPSQIPR
jgi:hypothetical protein